MPPDGTTWRANPWRCQRRTSSCSGKTCRGVRRPLCQKLGWYNTSAQWKSPAPPVMMFPSGKPVGLLTASFRRRGGLSVVIKGNVAQFLDETINDVSTTNRPHFLPVANDESFLSTTSSHSIAVHIGACAPNCQTSFNRGNLLHGAAREQAAQ